MSFVDFSQT